jgi:HSP20 family molecular chaperone IbpA
VKHSSTRTQKSNEIAQFSVFFGDFPKIDEQDLVFLQLIQWQPLYDLYVIDNEVITTIEIAGVAARDFALYLNKRYMIIEGVRKTARTTRANCCTFHNIEIPYGKFSRKIEFPVPVQPRKYNASLTDGMLVLRLPIVQEKVIPIEDEA